MLACGALYCAFGIVYLESGGAYDGGGSYYKTDLCEEIAYAQAENLYWMWVNDPNGAWLADYPIDNAEMGFSIANVETGDRCSAITSRSSPSTLSNIGQRRLSRSNLSAEPRRRAFPSPRA